jgi:hypothetical protein
MMSSRYHFIFALFLPLVSITFLLAQDTEYEKWRQNEEGKLQQFKEERDKEFTEFLKREWKAVDVTEGESFIEKPLPGPLPVYTGKAPELPPSEFKPVVTVEMQKPPALPPVEVKLHPSETFAHYAIFQYYTLPLKIGYMEVPALEMQGPITKEQISKAWDNLSGWNYKYILERLDQERKTHKLNDWGFVKLVYEAARSLIQNSKNESITLTWFLLTKAGYEVKVAYNEKSVHLLFPSAHRLYSVPYFTMNNDERRFYEPPLDRTGAPEMRVFTYDGKYPGSDKQLQFTVSALPELTGGKMSKELSFQYNDSTFHINTQYSKDAVQYFEYYPQTEYEIYFAAPLSQEATNSLLPQLINIVKGKSEVEAVNILLRFVQTAFQYKVDAEQFGREKPFFPDEILYYPYSNCKDRAIFFATLIRTILRYDVVGLYYPDHVATAVRFQGDIAGDAVFIQGRKFIICDPTYVNANIGMCMPQFKNVTPTVIKIRN